MQYYIWLYSCIYSIPLSLNKSISIVVLNQFFSKFDWIYKKSVKKFHQIMREDIVGSEEKKHFWQVDILTNLGSLNIFLKKNLNFQKTNVAIKRESISIATAIVPSLYLPAIWPGYHAWESWIFGVCYEDHMSCSMS